MNTLSEFLSEFRVVALTASPGSSKAGIQAIIDNLNISKVEFRTEESLDIAPHLHKQALQKIVVKLSDQVAKFRDTYLQIINTFVSKLKGMNMLFMKNVETVSSFMLIKQREIARKKLITSNNQQGANLRPILESNYAAAISLAHGLNLLQVYGLKPFFLYLKKINNGEIGGKVLRAQLNRLPVYADLMEHLDTKMAIFTPKENHPKFIYLAQIVETHFNSHDDTRIIIFSQYRTSVEEIVEFLSTMSPKVRPCAFIGQTKKTGDNLNYNQKKQLEVMENFKNNTFNCLVSTCIGEEGFDIGQVDLIVCFDAIKSPLRFIQRMGRTGRKRDGQIIILITEGVEENVQKASEVQKKNMKTNITSTKNYKLFENGMRFFDKKTKFNEQFVYIPQKEVEPPILSLSKTQQPENEESCDSIFSSNCTQSPQKVNILSQSPIIVESEFDNNSPITVDSQQENLPTPPPPPNKIVEKEPPTLNSSKYDFDDEEDDPIDFADTFLNDLIGEAKSNKKDNSGETEAIPSQKSIQSLPDLKPSKKQTEKIKIGQKFEQNKKSVPKITDYGTKKVKKKDKREKITDYVHEKSDQDSDWEILLDDSAISSSEDEKCDPKMKTKKSAWKKGEDFIEFEASGTQPQDGVSDHDDVNYDIEDSYLVIDTQNVQTNSSPEMNTQACIQSVLQKTGPLTKRKRQPIDAQKLMTIVEDPITETLAESVSEDMLDEDDRYVLEDSLLSENSEKMPKKVKIQMEQSGSDECGDDNPNNKPMNFKKNTKNKKQTNILTSPLSSEKVSNKNFDILANKRIDFSSDDDLVIEVGEKSMSKDASESVDKQEIIIDESGNINQNAKFIFADKSEVLRHDSLSVVLSKTFNFTVYHCATLPADFCLGQMISICRLIYPCKKSKFASLLLEKVDHLIKLYAKVFIIIEFSANLMEEHEKLKNSTLTLFKTVLYKNCKVLFSKNKTHSAELINEISTDFNRSSKNVFKNAEMVNKLKEPQINFLVSYLDINFPSAIHLMAKYLSLKEIIDKVHKEGKERVLLSLLK